MGMLVGKKALIFGVANDRSIAWGIAKALHAEGCQLGFSYVGEAMEKRVRPLAQSLGARIVLACDVTRDHQIEHLFGEVKRRWGRFDYLIHSVAFADKEEMASHFHFHKTSRAGFHLAMDVSVYSLLALTRHAVPILNPGGSILTLSYYGAEKVVPNYNIMGVAKAALESTVRYLAFDLGPRDIRVNAISAGPIKTLAASGVGNFKNMLKAAGEMTPLRRTVSQDEVGSTALFLCLPWSSGITGEVLYVDAGANIVGHHLESGKESGSSKD